MRVATFLILMVLAACGRNDVPLPTNDVPLPTFEAAEFCSTAALLPTRIEADPAADPAVWGINRAGERLDLAWPAGFTARPHGDTIEIAAPDGTIVARSGEWLAGAGGGVIQASNGLIGLCRFANWHR